MKLAKYWTRETGEATGRDGQRIRMTARGWSNDSMEAARAVAREIAQRLAQGNFPTRDKQYLYGDRPLPEPVLRDFFSAVVTRNIYGAEVLNTRDLMFVDIDQPEQRPSPIVSGIRALFGRSTPVSAVPVKIQSVAERNNLTGRAYRTAGGYRLLITSAPFRPGDSLAEDLLHQFDADPLYVRLCRMQESFRARLTPKPWRCGLQVPPVAFPFETPVEQSRFDAWERSYTAAAGGFATCRYLDNFGSGSVGSGFDELVRYHDQETKASSGLPLA